MIIIFRILNLTSKNFDSLESCSQINDDSLSLEYLDKKQDLLTPHHKIEPIKKLDIPYLSYREKTYKQRLEEEFENQLQQNRKNKYLHPTQK